MQHNSTVSAVAAAVWRYSSDARACVRAYACTILYDNYLLATLCTTATVLLCMIFPLKTPYTTTTTTIENRSGITVYYAASERRNTPPYVMGVCRRRLGQHFCRHNKHRRQYLIINERRSQQQRTAELYTAAAALSYLLFPYRILHHNQHARTTLADKTHRHTHTHCVKQCGGGSGSGLRVARR